MKIHFILFLLIGLVSSCSTLEEDLVVENQTSDVVNNRSIEIPVIGPIQGLVITGKLGNKKRCPGGFGLCDVVWDWDAIANDDAGTILKTSNEDDEFYLYIMSEVSNPEERFPIENNLEIPFLINGTTQSVTISSGIYDVEFRGVDYLDPVENSFARIKL